MELVLLGLSGLMLIAIWHFALKRSILDEHRDQLFDLRDELRATFVEKGWDMDSDLYGRLRVLINGYLRFTERYSFSDFVYLEAQRTSKPLLNAAIKEKFEAKFVAADQEQQKYINGLRRRAVGVMMNYMMVSSGPLLLMTMLLVPFVICRLTLKALGMLLHAGGASILSKAVQVQEVIAAIVALAAAVLAKKLLVKDFVEEYSYKQNALS